jgi:twinkle protein
MNVIGGGVDLSAYLQTMDLQAKVQPASEFLASVKAEFAPRDDRKRYPTMLAGKARGLEFRPGEVTCWAGYNGHRKSMFTSQVALDLCVQRQRVLIASLEMAPARTMARMSRQALAAERPDELALEDMHAWTDGRLWLFDHVGKLSGAECIALLRYFADQHRGQHVFIDSMMMIVDSEENMDESKRFVTDLCRVAVETGLHVHLITHCRKPPSGDDSNPPTKYDIKGTGAISDQASNVITVWSDREKAQAYQAGTMDALKAERPDAKVTVEKQRNGAWEGRLLFWLDHASLRFLPDRHTAAEPYHLAPMP